LTSLEHTPSPHCGKGEELQLGRGLDLGVAEVRKALKRAESVFRENPEIKQMLYYECLSLWLQERETGKTQ
jgi:hypothetical protein